MTKQDEPMPAPHGDPPFDYGVYTAQDAAEMARLLGEVFCRRDPPAVAVGLTPSESASNGGRRVGAD